MDKAKAGFIHDHLRQHSYVPGAKDVRYLHAWGQDPYNKYAHTGERNKGKFPKNKKILLTERVMHDAKRQGYPGPKYKVDDGFDVPKLPHKGDGQEKCLAFFEEA